MKKDKTEEKLKILEKKSEPEQRTYCSGVIDKIKKYKDREGIAEFGENISKLLIRHLIAEMGGFPDDALFVIKDTCIDFISALAHPIAKDFVDNELFDVEDLLRMMKGLIQFCHTANRKSVITDLDIAYLEENGIKDLGRAVALEEEYSKIN